jgi:UPF0755 protein
MAAVQPESTPALYFVATGLGDGAHHFSNTLEEHNSAVQTYLVRLRSQERSARPTPVTAAAAAAEAAAAPAPPADASHGTASGSRAATPQDAQGKHPR